MMLEDFTTDAIRIELKRREEYATATLGNTLNTLLKRIEKLEKQVRELDYKVNRIPPGYPGGD